MAQEGDLTTLPVVKDWLNTTNAAYPPGSDEKLARLITAASKFVVTYLRRQIVPQSYTEPRDGTGTDALFLRNRPVVSVSSLTVGLQAVPQSVPGSCAFGFLNDDTRVFAVGGIFPVGRLNVTVQYVGGYQATAPAVVPANGEKLALAGLSGVSQVDGTPAGPWCSDRGVTLAGVALERVPADPAAGQYSVKVEADGSWSMYFSAADGGSAVTVTYGYSPAELEQAVTELVGERFKVRNRIGEVSQNIGNGQTVSFSQRDMNAFVADILNQYKETVPV